MASEAIWHVEGVNVAGEPTRTPPKSADFSRSLFVCPACGTKVRVISGEGWLSCCGQPMFVLPFGAAEI
jgi:desulfoferrodoxin-like iron-binding protein